ncbi:uncharacterized protein LOC116417994 [Nasonia vitripennis]|uniref:CCHC-type domain-containing protein n=1 Tax=Nasonia vitripennis TaxID=7425 RepID=A0A7M7QKD3_NASVI|nr:uncharacterized protein LOC116417994 [Nasonia vitripennis]
MKTVSWADHLAEIEEECEGELRAIEQQREKRRRSRPATDMTRTADIWARRSPAPPSASPQEEGDKWKAGVTETRIPKKTVVGAPGPLPLSEEEKEAYRREGIPVEEEASALDESRAAVVELEALVAEDNDLTVVIANERAGTREEYPRLRGPNGKRRRYNPMRHLKADDFESVVAGPSRRRDDSPPGAPIRREAFEVDIPFYTPPPAPLNAPPMPRLELLDVESDSSGSPSLGAVPRRYMGTTSAGSRTRSRSSRRRNAVRLDGVMFGGLAPIATDPAVDPPPRACFNCWRVGHRRTECLLNI